MVIISYLWSDLGTMRKAIILSICVALIWDCVQVDYQHALEDASALFQVRPDSSLAILQSFKLNDLKSNKDRAMYALLKSAAYDKNYIDLQSDSLTSIAVDYYSGRRGYSAQELMAWYYHGIVQKNAAEYEKAIVSFEIAERLAETTQDDYYLGLICQNKAVVFNARNNIVEAIICIKKAVDSFDRAGKPLYSIYAKLALARLYTTNKDYNLAEEILDSIEPESPNEYFLNDCRLLRANGLAADNKNLSKAVRLYTMVPEEYFHITDYGRLAIAYERLGQKDSASLMTEKAYRNCNNELDSASVDFMISRVEFERHNYKSAYDLALNASMVQDSLTRILLTQSVNNALKDYYHEDAKQQELKVKQERKLSAMSIIIIVLSFSIILLVLCLNSRKKDETIKEQMAQISLQHDEMSRVLRDNALMVSSAFNEKYFHLEKISTEYYSCTNTREKENLLKRFKQQIGKIKDDEQLFSDLDALLDKNCNGVMSKLKEQVPEISGRNLRTISLLFAGMPYRLVQILMGSQSVNALKTAKNRYRNTIKDSNAIDKELFLSLLSSKR